MRKGRRSAAARTLLPIVIIVAVAALWPFASGRGLAAAPTLTDIRALDELKQWFNAERGHARVILLLSPT